MLAEFDFVKCWLDLILFNVVCVWFFKIWAWFDIVNCLLDFILYGYIYQCLQQSELKHRSTYKVQYPGFHIKYNILVFSFLQSCWKYKLNCFKVQEHAVLIACGCCAIMFPSKIWIIFNWSNYSNIVWLGDMR